MRKGAVFLIVGVLVLLGACRSSATSTSTSTTMAGEVAEFPVTVDSDLGPVTIAQRPERIVSLSATHTEVLYALGAGDQVIATDVTSNYPAAADDTVKLDSFSFNVEAVVALQPDLVILAFDFQGEAEALEALDIRFLLLGPPADLQGAFDQMLVVGEAAGRRMAASVLVDDLAADLEVLVQAGKSIAGASIFHEIDDTLFSASSESFIGDLYRRLGLVNIADGADAAGPFPQLSSEFIVDQDPEFIFLADAGFGVSVESVESRPGWETIRAVADGNVVPLDGDIAGRWGPRTLQLMGTILDAVEAGRS